MDENSLKNMTIARGLTRLKTIKAQLSNNVKILDSSVISSKGKSSLADNKLALETNHEIAKSVLASSLQQTYDLMNEFVDIKSAIVRTNENTSIVVAGKTMTIAQAMVIRRDILWFYQEMISAYSRSRINAEMYVERYNNQVLSSATSDRDKEILMASVISFVSPEDIEKLKTFVTTFVAELDGTLNEANATTYLI